jgi:subfamily B ATP-binding cassette protein MsbA
VKPFFKMEFKDRHRQILSLIKKNTGRLVFAAGCSLMISAATTATGYLIKPVIDDIFVNKDTTGLVLLPLFVVAVF